MGLLRSSMPCDDELDEAMAHKQAMGTTGSAIENTKCWSQLCCERHTSVLQDFTGLHSCDVLGVWGVWRDTK